jgi:hypothetical protein
MHLASDEARYKLPEKERAALKAALARNGIEDPAVTLMSVRAAALALELASPELAAGRAPGRGAADGERLVGSRAQDGGTGPFTIS